MLMLYWPTNEQNKSLFLMLQYISPHSIIYRPMHCKQSHPSLRWDMVCPVRSCSVTVAKAHPLEYRTWAANVYRRLQQQQQPGHAHKVIHCTQKTFVAFKHLSQYFFNMSVFFLSFNSLTWVLWDVKVKNVNPYHGKPEQVTQKLDPFQTFPHFLMF